MWKSAAMLCEFAADIPELVGSLEDVKEEGAEPVQKECTPPPICKEAGYTAFEWFRHWENLKETVCRAVTEEQRTEWMRMIRRKLRA